MIDLVLGLSVCILEINLSYSYSWNSYAGLFCPELLASDSNPSAIVQASGSRGRGCEEGSMPGDHHRHDQPSHRHHSHKVSQGVHDMHLLLCCRGRMEKSRTSRITTRTRGAGVGRGERRRRQRSIASIAETSAVTSVSMESRSAAPGTGGSDTRHAGREL